MFFKFSVGALSALLCLNVAQAAEYDLIDLGTLGGDTSYAWDINNLCHVTGWSHVSEDPFVLHAFIYKNGNMIDIGAGRDDRSSAFAINDSNQVVSSSGLGSNGAAYLYENGSWVDLGVGSSSNGRGINNNGEIVGWLGGTRAFVYSNGVVLDIGSLADDRAAAFDINDSAQVVGVTGTWVSGERGFLYESGVMTDLGVGSRAHAINNAGQIVGESNQRAALYENGAWSLLGGLPQYKSNAADINDNGQIVGSFDVSEDNTVRFAFLYDAGGITILESLEGNYTYATAINNAGQIVGVSTTATGESRAVMWQPVSSDTDSDGILNDSDNCRCTSNFDQSDLDNDQVGDACDVDDDNDTIPDTSDNCPLIPNSSQADVDQDGIGDACDDLSDSDADGILDDVDNCPAVPNADQTNTDGLNDGGDACDSDDDNDSVEDVADNCPVTVNTDQTDSDVDNIGDACDADDDNDGVPDTADNCPLAANSGQENTDLDGQGDACDLDDDNDTIPDTSDNCPLTANPDQTNTDGVGAGDACNSEFDLDGDEYEDGVDNCPAIANSNQSDFDQDGLGDACDADQDDDEIDNGIDVCPNTPTNIIVNGDGCTIAQLCPCEGPRQSTESWRNHGQYVSCVTQSANSFYKDGLLTSGESGAITSEAANSGCGYAD